MFEYSQRAQTPEYEKGYKRIFGMMHKGKKGMCKAGSSGKGGKKTKKKK